MKHIFVVNPTAGKGKGLAAVREQVKDRPGCEILLPGSAQETVEMIRQRAEASPEEELCFVACGGDGTVNAVANGVLSVDNACMTVFALGSGNDYIKVFGGKSRFTDVETILRAEPHPVDVLRVNDRWCVNAFHFGLDSAVAKTMNEVKEKAVIGGRNAYPTGVAKALIFSMRTPCSIRVDGEEFHSGDMLLCTVACGEYVGGSYRCAPRSILDDGLAEICLVKPVSRLRFLTLMNAYKTGQHLTDPRFTELIQYRRGRVIEVEGDPGFIVSLDGEVVEGTSFRAEVVPGRLRFAAADPPTNGWSAAAPVTAAGETV